MRPTLSVTSCAALALCSASTRTSCATTPNPRPAAPARAASIAAFRASRLVCVAISEITCTKSSTTPVASRSPLISCWDASTVSRATRSVSSAACTWSRVPLAVLRMSCPAAPVSSTASPMVAPASASWCTASLAALSASSCTAAPCEISITAPVTCCDEAAAAAADAVSSLAASVTWSASACTCESRTRSRARAWAMASSRSPYSSAMAWRSTVPAGIAQVAAAERAHLRAQCGERLRHRARRAHAEERRDREREQDHHGERQLALPLREAHLLRGRDRARADRGAQGAELRFQLGDVPRGGHEDRRGLAVAPQRLEGIGAGDAHLERGLQPAHLLEHEALAQAEHRVAAGRPEHAIRFGGQHPIALRFLLAEHLQEAEPAHHLAEHGGDDLLGQLRLAGQLAHGALGLRVRALQTEPAEHARDQQQADGDSEPGQQPGADGDEAKLQHAAHAVHREPPRGGALRAAAGVVSAASLAASPARVTTTDRPVTSWLLASKAMGPPAPSIVMRSSAARTPARVRGRALRTADPMAMAAS